MSRARTLGWLQAGLGLGPLLLYVVFHLWQLLPAFEGREEWLVRQRAGPSAWLLALLVLLPLLSHAALGAWRLRNAPAGPSHERGRQRVQAVTGGLVLAFLGLHLTQVWGLGQGPHTTPLRAFDELWQQLPRPLFLFAYAVGVSAVCLHLTHGLVSVAERALPRGPAGVRQTLRVVLALAGLALWIAWVQVLGLFAIGEPLLPLPGFGPWAASLGG